MDKLAYLKSLIVTKYAALVQRAQRGYLLDRYKPIVQAMESINLIANYTDASSPYYLQPYQVTTFLDYHISELNKL